MSKTKEVCFLEEGIEPALLERFGTNHNAKEFMYFPLFDTKPKVMRIDIARPGTSSDKEITVVYLEQVVRRNHPNGNDNVKKEYSYEQFDEVLRGLLATKKGKYYAEKWPETYEPLTPLKQ